MTLYCMTNDYSRRPRTGRQSEVKPWIGHRRHSHLPKRGKRFIVYCGLTR